MHEKCTDASRAFFQWNDTIAFDRVGSHALFIHVAADNVEI